MGNRDKATRYVWEIEWDFSFAFWSVYVPMMTGFKWPKISDGFIWVNERCWQVTEISVQRGFFCGLSDGMIEKKNEYKIWSRLLWWFSTFRRDLVQVKKFNFCFFFFKYQYKIKNMFCSWTSVSFWITLTVENNWTLMANGFESKTKWTKEKNPGLGYTVGGKTDWQFDTAFCLQKHNTYRHCKAI